LTLRARFLYLAELVHLVLALFALQVGWDSLSAVIELPAGSMEMD
jgi:hypothetical protein